VQTLAGLLAASVFGCAVFGYADADAGLPRLVLISPHRDELREEVALAFQDWLAIHAASDPSLPPRCRVVWQDIGGGSSQILKYVNARFGDSQGQGIGIDLLFGGGTDIFLRLAKDGRLQPLTLPRGLIDRSPAQLNGVPLRDPEGRWQGPMVTSFGILCNRRVLGRIGVAPPDQGGDHGWGYLADPALRGWIAAGDPRLTGSVHMVYEIILQSHGWDDGYSLLLRMGANAHSFIRDSGTLTRMVLNGEVAAAGTLDANGLGAVSRDPDGVLFYLPPGETIVNADALAVLQGAPNPALAKAFVEFMLSDAGQKLLILRPGLPGGPRRSPLCRLSVVEDLYRRYPPEERSIGAANPFTLHSTITYDAAKGSARWDALNDLFGATIMDAHPDLAAAWNTLATSHLPQAERLALEADLFRPPCTEAELKEVTRRVADGGPRVRIATVNGWGDDARQRYRQVARQAGR
jgi:ABC-type Fe3+ transport system substrate-binding protein